MRISVFGLGYVGSVTAACFADWGHSVIGVDPNEEKVSLINDGRAPVIEAGLEALIARGHKKNLLTATTNADDAVVKSDISFVCVGTPSQADGKLDCRYLEEASRSIGGAIARKNNFHTVAVRSTLLPGTLRDTVIPALEKETGWKAGADFGVCHNPEFLREGSAIHDFHNPSRTVIGAGDERSGDILQELYKPLSAPIIRCPIDISEMVKYADNAWHAAKVVFANEIGSICKAHAIDSHQVMDIFCRDTKLNISSAYLKPGFAFGGSCLPKDILALTAQAQSRQVKTPLLNALIPSNQSHIAQGLATIRATGRRNIGFLGLSFKAGTDDLRCSPMVEIVQQLIAEGINVRVYDNNITIAKLLGANRDYVMKAIPSIEKLMAGSIEELLTHSETIVIGNSAPEFAQISGWLRPDHHIVDFVRIPLLEQTHANYSGICW